MIIDTTLNIHRSILMKFDESSKKTGFTRNQIIVRLLRRAMSEYPRLYHQGPGRIKYQERDEEKQWEPKHVWWKSSEYDYFQDMKKVYKMSISHILAYAVENFLKDEIYWMIRTKSTKRYDNYLFSGYSSVGEMADNVICWKFFWGIPRNLNLLLPKSPL